MKCSTRWGVILFTVSVIFFLSSNQTFAWFSDPCEPDWPEPHWPEIFEPNQSLMNLNIEFLDVNDWNDVRLNGLLWDDGEQDYIEPADPDIYTYERPAWFWVDGEEDLKIKVGVRQKSNIPLGDANDRYFKISFKVDINQYYTEDETGQPNGDPNAVSHWHDLSKLSLENGDDVDVVAEGLACNLHTLSSGSEGYGYDAWRGNWVTLNVQGVNRGVYVNNEQRNKQFLHNRNLLDRNVEPDEDIWMYKVTGENETLMKVPDKDSGEVPPDYPDSPGFTALNYTPFNPTAPPPDDTTLVADMNTYVNMQSMLSMAAINAFISNPDSLFSHYQNTYFIDFNLNEPGETRKRMYLPWDVDAIMNNLDMDIYDRENGSTTWQDVFLDSPTYRPQYNQIFKDLMETTFTRSNIHSFMDMMLPILHDDLATDSYNQFDVLEPDLDQVNEHFKKIKTWYSDRIVNILDQLWWDEPNGVVLIKDGFEGTPWDNNFSNGGWIQDIGDYKSSYNSAKSNRGNRGVFSSNALDASDANAIHVSFWFMKDALDPGTDVFLYYHNGTTASDDLILDDFDIYGSDKKWLHYADVITDSNYFTTDFKVIIDSTTLDSNKEFINIDDVIVTKITTELPEPEISGYVLNRIDTPIPGVTVSAPGGGSGVTDENGYYSFTVLYGWKGAITPIESAHTFNPDNRTSYNFVVIDHPERWVPDYVGTSIYDLNTDGYTNFQDYAIFALAWGSTPVDSNWNGSCDYEVNLAIDANDLNLFMQGWMAP
ncbi:MAG: CotH kinase family protein [Planctomycetota bacterium]|jgi:hypothetical protein